MFNFLSSNIIQVVCPARRKKSLKKGSYVVIFVGAIK